MKRVLIIICAIFGALFTSNMAAFADDYLTISFNNGQDKQYFYLCDIDSMTLSKMNIDGTLNTDWCVQEICMPDTVYRYPLSTIESIDIRKVNREEMVQNIVSVANAVGPLFLQHSSMSELKLLLPQIRQNDNVEKAWIDGSSLHVRVKDGGVISYLYPEKPVFSFESEARKLQGLRQLISSVGERVSRYQGKSPEAVVVNQMWQDNNFEEANEYFVKLSTAFEECHFSVQKEYNPNTEFYNKVLPNADLVFMMTHGSYMDGCHYLRSGDEIAVSETGELTEQELIEYYIKKHHLSEEDRKKGFTLHYCSGVEKRGKDEDAKDVLVYYERISQHTIAKMPSFRNRGKVVMFNVACQSLKGDYSLGKIFLDKGAACYLGYDESNAVGPEAGLYFFANMLDGKSATNAYSALRGSLKNTKNKEGNDCHLTLLGDGDVYIVYPTTPEQEVETDNESDFTINLKSSMVMSSPVQAKYGFEVSKSEDMAEPEYFLARYNDRECQYDESDHVMCFDQTLTQDHLEPGTRYFIKAVKSEDGNVCESEENLELVTPSLFNVITMDAVKDGSQVELCGSVSGVGPDVDPVEAGFLFSEVGEPWEEGAQYVSAGRIGPSKDDIEFHATLTSLKRNTIYRYVACVFYDGYYFMDQLSSKFNLGVQITTEDPTHVRAKSARLRGRVDVSQLSERDAGLLGFYYTTTGEPSKDNGTFVGAGSLRQAIANDGMFEADIKNLTPDDYYNYVAAMISEDGIIYGNTLFFQARDPDFYASASAYSITDSSAIININVNTSVNTDEYTAGFYIRKKGENGEGVYYAVDLSDGYNDFGNVEVTGLDEDAAYVVTPIIWYEGEQLIFDAYEFTTRPIHPEKKAGLMVDLGLSVCWAAWNIGAINDKEAGMHFRWGGITKDDEGLDYTNSENISGGSHDAAAMNWGGSWRMPTKDEYEELISKCNFMLDYANNGEYVIVVGPNGNAIRFPYLDYISSDAIAQGYDYNYWTGTVVPSEEDEYNSFGYMFRLDYKNPTVTKQGKRRYLYIRAVCPNPVDD